MCKCVKCNQLITPRSIECKKFQKNFRFWLTQGEDQTFEFDLYREKGSVEMKAIGAMDSL